MSGLSVSKVNTQPFVLETALTEAYTVYDWFNVGAYDSCVFYIAYQMGATEAGNDIEIKIEFSHKETYGYQQTQSNIYSGHNNLEPITHKFPAVSAAEIYDRFVLPVDISWAKYMRISIKENGVAVNVGKVIVNVNLGWS